MNTDIGMGLEKWMAVHKPYEWINEDLRQAVVKNMANEWKWGKDKDWTLNLNTEEVEEAADDDGRVLAEDRLDDEAAHAGPGEDGLDQHRA